MRQLPGFGNLSRVLEAEMLAGEVEPLVGPRPQYDLDRLAKPRRALLGRHAKGGEFDARKAAAGAPIN